MNKTLLHESILNNSQLAMESKIYIPKSILQITGSQKFTRDEVGKSESTVLMFPDYVLKIQKHTAETDNEVKIISWLKDSIPCPQILKHEIENDTSYTLESRIKGKMLCDEEYLNNKELLLDLVADGIKSLWKVDVTACPVTEVSPLTKRLEQARYNVEHNLVDLDDAEEDTFGPQGFKDPMDLLLWLENNRPEEDIVLSHGDFCLPNVFAEGKQITGFIDLGKMGPADRWNDVAIAIRSLDHNASGFYTNGKKCFDFIPEMLLERLGIKMDFHKNKYYKLLDELF